MPRPSRSCGELLDEPVERPDEDVRRVDDLLHGDLVPAALLHPGDDLGGLALQVVGDRDRPGRRVDVERQVVEPLAGRLPDPADLLLGRRPGERPRVGPAAAQDPWRQADDLRLAGGQLEGGPAAAADEERRVRLLHRLRLRVVVGDRVVLTRERERVGAEAALDDGHRLGQPRLPDPDRVERQTDGVVLGLVPAGAERHVEPALGQRVEGGQLLGEHGRMAQVVVVHEGADPDPLGERGDGREVRHRRRLADEVVRQHERRDAEVLRGAGPLAELAGTRHVERVGKERERLRHQNSTSVRRRERSGFTADVYPARAGRFSKCRWQPSGAARWPERAMTCPRVTRCPGWTSSRRACPIT